MGKASLPRTVSMMKEYNDATNNYGKLPSMVGAGSGFY